MKMKRWKKSLYDPNRWDGPTDMYFVKVEREATSLLDLSNLVGVGESGLYQDKYGRAAKKAKGYRVIAQAGSMSKSLAKTYPTKAKATKAARRFMSVY